MHALFAYASLRCYRAVSAFLLTLSLIPSKSVLAEQLEELKARDPLKREEQRLPIIEHIVHRRAAHRTRPSTCRSGLVHA